MAGQVLRTGIALPGVQLDLLARHADSLQPVRGHLVGRDQAGLPTQFRRHVGQGHPFLHPQRSHRAAAVLDRLVLTACHAEAAAEEEHHVLGPHPGGKPAAPVDADGLRHLQPDFPGHQHTQHFGGADAEHVAAEGAAGA